MAAMSWRRHIVRQLRHRDRRQQDMFRDLIRTYTRMLDRSSLTSGILGCSERSTCSDLVTHLLNQNNQLRATTGELACQVVELQQKIQIKECVLEEQHARLWAEQSRLAEASGARQALHERVEQVKEDNAALKMQYDQLLERQEGAETQLRAEKLKEEHMLEDVIDTKRQAAARLNSRNERKSRAREAKLQKELQSAARSKVTVDSSSTSPGSPQDQGSTGRAHVRLFRSASATSPRILTSIKELFHRKRRGHSVCSLEEDLACPVGICVAARVPVMARHVLEAHDQSINAVRFSSSSDLLATGGTDRLVKVWEVRAGALSHRGTLNGSTEGVTCVDFDAAGSRIMAGSHDKSALLWRLDDCVPKLTLTGHRRKVTAARFSSSLHQVVTGSADGSVRLWDLHRAACVQVAEVASHCGDLVCSESCVISGHYDSKIRVWDSRVESCVQELPARGKVTSLDLGADRRHLLSCCRDDCLQLVDLRRWSQPRACLRADGFKCGSDSTKAVISPDGAFLAAGSADGAVYVWNASSGDLETRLAERHSSSVSAVSWSPSGDYVVSVDKSRRAVLWSGV